MPLKDREAYNEYMKQYIRGLTDAKNTHGTISSYRYCRCELCKKAKSDYSRQYNKRKKLRS